MSEITVLKLDDCSHCAALTPLSGFTVESAIAALQSGELGCWLCSEDPCEDCGEPHHTTCVVLYANGQPVWDGRCKQAHPQKRLKHSGTFPPEEPFDDAG